MATAFSRVVSVTKINDFVTNSDSSTSYTVPSGKFALVSVMASVTSGASVAGVSGPINKDLNFYLGSGDTLDILSASNEFASVYGLAIEMNNP